MLEKKNMLLHKCIAAILYMYVKKKKVFQFNVNGCHRCIVLHTIHLMLTLNWGMKISHRTLGRLVLIPLLKCLLFERIQLNTSCLKSKK